MNLVSLPREILDHIFSLALKDLKSLRLTCNELAGITAAILFCRVRVSPLIQDFQSFFSISKSPHLAIHVRVIVWEELGGSFRLDEGRWPEYLGNDSQLYKDVTENARKLFLLDIESASGDPNMDAIDDTFLTPRSNLPDEFLYAIGDTMPNLHTLVSKPMDSRRCLEIPSMDYTISVEALKSILLSGQRTCLFNLGFTAFLLPAMESLTSQSRDNSINKITQLFYADEGASINTSLTRINSCAKAFEHLRHLDLCIAIQDAKTCALTGFWSCLANAKNLTSLRLCSEGGPISCSPGHIPTLPQLIDVEFVELNLLLDPLISATAKFIERHAGTLKRLYFTSSPVMKKLLHELANMNKLHLERFVVTSGYDPDDDSNFDAGSISDSDAKHEYMNEQAVLNYINFSFDPHRRDPLPRSQLSDDRTQIHTHPLVFDAIVGELSAYHETRDNGWEKRGYELIDVEMLDRAVFERRDKNGIAYDIGPGRIRYCDSDL